MAAKLILRSLVIGVCAIAPMLMTSCNFGFMGMNSDAINGSNAINGNGLVAGPATALSISGPASVVSGVCSSLFRVTGIDSNNLPSENFPQGTVAQISGIEMNAIFLDANCTLPAVSGLIPVSGNSNYFDFYISGISDGAKLLFAQVQGLPSTLAPLVVQAGPPASLSLILPGTINANTCAPGSLGILDASGNLTTSLIDIVSNLQLSVGNGTAFYSDPTCDNIITSVTIQAGLSSRALYVLSPAAIPFTATAVGGSGIQDSQRTVQVLAANTPKLVLSGPAGSITAGICTPFQVETKLPDNSTYKVRSATPITLTPNLSLTKFYSDPGCGAPTLIPNNVVTLDLLGFRKTFYAVVTQANQIDLRIDATSPGFSSAQTQHPVVADVPAMLVFSNIPPTIAAGACSGGSQVELRDRFGNVATTGSMLNVDLRSLTALVPFEFFSSAGCGGAASAQVIIPNGSSLASFYFKARNPGSAMIEARYGSLTPAVSSAITITNAQGTPITVKFDGNPTVVVGSPLQLKLQSRDANDNPLDVSPNPLNFNLNSTGSVANVFFSDAGCSNAISSIAINAGANESAPFYFCSTKVEVAPFVLSATSGALVAFHQIMTLPERAEQLDIEAIGSVPAGACIAAQVVAKDRYGNRVVPVPSVQVTFPTTLQVNYYSDSSCQNLANGVLIAAPRDFATFYFKVDTNGNNAATNSVVIFAHGPVGVAADSEQVDVDAPDQIHVTLTGPASFPVNTCQDFYFSALDQNNQLMVRDPIPLLLSIQGPVAGITFYSDASCNTVMNSAIVTISQGNNPKHFYAKATVADVYIISSGPGASVTVNVNPGPASKLVIVPSQGPSNVDRDICVGPYRVESQDSLGNLSGVASSFAVASAFSNGVVGAIYSDNACSNLGISFATGDRFKQFYLKITSGTGITNLTASGGGLTPGSRSLGISDPTTIQFKIQNVVANSVNFGNVPVNSTSAVADIEVTNIAAANITLNTITVPSPFRLVAGGTCANGSVLAPNASCTLKVDFAPSQTGIAADNLTIALTLVGNNLQKLLGLSGNGTAANAGILTFNPTSLNFQTVLKGITSTQSVTLVNSGVAPVTDITFAAGTELSPSGQQNCPSSLNPGESCTFNVQLNAQNVGNFSGSLLVGYTAGTTSKTASLPVIASVVEPAKLVFKVNGGTVASVDFQNRVVNTEFTIAATLVNEGSISAVGISLDPLVGVFTYDSVCGATLAPGATCGISLKFKPTASASYIGTFSFSYDSLGYENLPNRTGSVSLSGAGFSYGLLTYNPDLELNFLDLLVGRSLTLPVTLKNTGNLAVSAIQIDPGSNYSSAGFTVDLSNCGGSLASGAGCTMNVVFQPASAGQKLGSLRLTYNNGNSAAVAPPMSSAAYRLVGNGLTQANLIFSPSPLSFGNVVKGMSSPVTYIDVTNSGNDPANLVSVLGTGSSAFQLAPSIAVIGGPNCSGGSVVAPGATCRIGIVFSPASNVAYNGSFAVNYRSAQTGANGAILTSSVNVTGTGVNPGVASFVETSVQIPYGLGNPASQREISIRNDGAFAVSVTNFTNLGSPLTLKPGTCGNVPFSIAVGATCKIVVEFTSPNAVDQTRSVTFTYHNGAANVTSSALSLRFYAGPRSIITFTPTGTLTPLTAKDFGSVEVGASSALALTLKNTGIFPVNILSEVEGAPFLVEAGTCPAPFAPGASCNISIVFSPTTRGAYAARNVGFMITDAGFSTPQGYYLSVQGTGIKAGEFAIENSPVDFGNVAVGAVKSIALTVRNVGDKPANVTAAVTLNPTTGFTVVSHNCTNIVANGTCLLTVKFSPTQYVNYGSDVSFTYNDSIRSVSKVVGRVIGRGTYATPTMTSISPNKGPISGSTIIYISGSNFRPDSTVTVGGVACPVVSSSCTPSVLACITPPGSLGAKDVEVTNPDGQKARIVGGFTYTSTAPTISSIVPNTIGASSSIEIRIYGTNFVSGMTVKIGNNACPLVGTVTATSFLCLAPSNGGVPGKKNVTVTKTATNESVTLIDGIEYVVPVNLDCAVLNAVSNVYGDPNHPHPIEFSLAWGKGVPIGMYNGMAPPTTYTVVQQVDAYGYYNDSARLPAPLTKIVSSTLPRKPLPQSMVVSGTTYPLYTNGAIGSVQCPAFFTVRRSPLIVDIYNEGILLSAPNAGVKFDIIGDGVKSAISWPTNPKSSMFVVLDRNGNGNIDSVHELFGNNTVGPDDFKANNGFEALMKYDQVKFGGNQDGLIDSRDAIFSQLKLWSDLDRDGVVDSGELYTLAEKKVKSIDLKYVEMYERNDFYGNESLQRSVIQMTDLSLRKIFDVWFVPGE